MQPKAIVLDGKPAGSARFPAICAPLVGRSHALLLQEAGAVAAKQPDIIEWRVDYFEDIADSAAVIKVAEGIKRIAPDVPILFTRRSSKEGGEPIAISEAQVIDLYRAICASGHVELVDYEMSNEPGHVREVRELSRTHGVKLILSFHDFDKTPGTAFLDECFAAAQRLDADIAKVAVMPRSMDDVLTLFTATLNASRTLRIPVVSMAMGGFGSVSRMCGWAFGSAMTFAVGQSSSAPGQMPIEDIEAGIAMMQKAFGSLSLRA
jgi:3-dehydroquinate dehydratase I